MKIATKVTKIATFYIFKAVPESLVLCISQKVRKTKRCSRKLYSTWEESLNLKNVSFLAASNS